jgi:hypothetical protein
MRIGHKDNVWFEMDDLTLLTIVLIVFWGLLIFFGSE